MRFLTGGYTADMNGHATGIGMLVTGTADDRLAGGPLGFTGDVAPAASPSWVAAHPTLDVVYAALEGVGAVQAFTRTGDATFSALGRPVPTGALCCHVVADPAGTALVAACWGDGRVVRMPLDGAGRIGAPQIAAAAVDPYDDPIAGAGTGLPAAPVAQLSASERVEALAAAVAAGRAAGVEQDGAADGAARNGAARNGAAQNGAAGNGAGGNDSVGDGDPGNARAEDAASEADERVSRAHEALFLPGGVVVTTDMGLDLVRIWRQSPQGLVPMQQLVLPRGVGPRHMRLHASGYLFVVTELSQEIFVLAADRAGVWRVATGSPLGAGVAASDTAAELTCTRDGQFLHAGVRGSNTIATLRVRGDGSQLEPVALVEAGVDWPRHHIVERDTLLVAGQRSDEAASLAIDERTGVPGRVRYRAAVPSPTCLLPLH